MINVTIYIYILTYQPFCSCMPPLLFCTSHGYLLNLTIECNTAALYTDSHPSITMHIIQMGRYEICTHNKI